MVDEIGVMISAVVVAVIFMMLFARPIGDFVERHPTVKMLALAFLLMIGTNRGGLGPAHSEGLHLFRDGFLSTGGNAESAGEEGGEAAGTSQAAVCGADGRAVRADGKKGR
jgi:hypothetical protein